MEIDDDSEVIYEFDLNSSTSNCDLFAFSAKDYPFDKSNTILESIKLKPIAKQFEIVMKFDDSKTSFSKKKDNELLIKDNLNDEIRKKTNELAKKDEDKNLKMMQFKVLKSNYLQETEIQYGICYLTKTKKVLDIVPIQRVYDFRTDFEFLDNDESLNKSAGKWTDKSNNETSKSDDNQPLSLPIELQNFTLRYETNFEHASWSHVNYLNLKERTTKEPWKLLKLINKSKDVRNLGRKKKKIVKFSDQISLELNNNLTNYSSKHCLLPKELMEDQSNDLNNISLTKIKKLQLSEKINKLLINCIAIPFYKLVNLLASDLDEELIIKILQKSAMLVQGNWVIKSELLYSTNLNEFAIIHDFISYCFSERKQLKRTDILSQIKFPMDSLMLVLNKLARFDSQTRSWHFIYPADQEFLKKYEQIKVQMEINWQIRKLQIFKNLNMQIEKFCEKTTSKRKPAIIKKKLDGQGSHKIIKKRLKKRKTKLN